MSDHAKEPGAVVAALERAFACHDLPDPLPEDPMPLLAEWYEDAHTSGQYDDYNAMTLATATPEGVPSARIVLCKSIEPDTPAIVFYTSYASRKGRELESNPNASAVFYWPHAKRQARIEGRVRRTSDAESDAYFNTRPLLSRIGASVSPQSREIGSRQAVVAEAMQIASRSALGARVQRPADWGGYRIIITRVELWSAGQGRLHDRAQWLNRDGAWSARRLGA